VQLWRCVAPFVDETLFADIKHLASSPNEMEKRAAALVCIQTSFAPAKELLKNELSSYANDSELSWQTITEKESAAL
jgi:hypothetical protein